MSPENIVRSFTASWRPAMLWALFWAVLSLWLNSHALINRDNAGLLHATQRMLNGEIPYESVYEVNPPLIMGLYALPLTIAHVLNTSLPVTFACVITVLSCFSLWLCYGEFRRHPLLAQPAFGGFPFAALAQVMLGCSPYIFGQREHLFILLAMPFLLQSLRAPSALTFRAAAIAMLAGIAFALKPYFLLIWVAGELCISAYTCRLSTLARRANVIILAITALYATIVYEFFPAYIHNVLPLLWPTYGRYTPSPQLFIQLGGLVTLYLLPSLLMRKSLAQSRLASHLACLVLGACLVAAIQGKGWINHFYPAIALGVLLSACMFSALLAQLLQRDISLNQGRFAMLWSLAIAAYILPIVQLVTVYRLQDFEKAYMQALNEQITANHAEGKPLMALSMEMNAIFPAVLYENFTYPFHFHHLWMFPALLQASADPKLAPVRDKTLETIAADITDIKPPLVLVDDNPAAKAVFPGFNMLEYLQQNPAFRKEWGHYQQVSEIHLESQTTETQSANYIVYRRMENAQ